MQHNKQYVSNALKMYNAIQPAIPLPVSHQDVIDVEFRELPPTVARINEVQRLMTLVRFM
jgi:hypothetical protein